MNILLTGASRGIGEATFAALTKAGHRVVGQSTAGSETLVAADSMSSTIAAIRSDTENVAQDIDSVEQGFGRFSAQIEEFRATTSAFVSTFAA